MFLAMLLLLLLLLLFLRKTRVLCDNYLPFILLFPFLRRAQKQFRSPLFFSYKNQLFLCLFVFAIFSCADASRNVLRCIAFKDQRSLNRRFSFLMRKLCKFVAKKLVILPLSLSLALSLLPLFSPPPLRKFLIRTRKY